MSTTWVIARPTIRQVSKCIESRTLFSLDRGLGSRRYTTVNHSNRLDEAEAEWKHRANAIQSGEAKSVLRKLEERGLVNQIVGNRDDLERVLTETRTGVYCGVDPTAASLHIGHMVPFMALGWLYVHGYSSTFLLGGFTASIGDPTDRLTARDPMLYDVRRENAQNMFEQLKKLGAGMERYAERRGIHREWAWRRSVKNNAEWWTKMTIKEFLESIGTVTRIGPLLGRDSVKNRLEKGDGMSFAEFSYPLIQGWDWWHLYQDGTQIQIGGADQFGNILAGAEAVKALRQRPHKQMAPLYQKETSNKTLPGDPMGFTVPLLTTSSGEKFGKSAGNAIWIDPGLTSSYDLYQFFLRSADEDVERYLKMLTFLPLSEIRQLMDQHQIDPSKRLAQRKLGDEFVELVHGLPAARKAREQHEQMYSTSLSLDDIKAQAVAANAKSVAETNTDKDTTVTVNSNLVNMTLPRSLVFGQNLARILHHASLATSRSDGQRQINAGGVYIAGSAAKAPENKLVDENHVVWTQVKDGSWSAVEPMLLDEQLLVLRIGKWNRKYITVVSDEDYRASGQTCPGWSETSNEIIEDQEKKASGGQ